MTQEIKSTIQKRDSLYDKNKTLRRHTDKCAFREAKYLVKQKNKQARNRYIEKILGLTDCLEQTEPNCQSSPESHKSTLASKKLFSLLKSRTPKALPPQEGRSKVRLFADDTAIYLAISSLEDAQVLQQDFDHLHQWELDWDMEFNPGKCIVIRTGQPRYLKVQGNEENTSSYPKFDIAKM